MIRLQQDKLRKTLVCDWSDEFCLPDYLGNQQLYLELKWVFPKGPDVLVKPNLMTMGKNDSHGSPLVPTSSLSSPFL